MNSMIKAIPTSYKGYLFRSRLEARWAAFYEAIGMRWSYENDPIRIKGENYLPDFIVGSDARTSFIHEVKPENERVSTVPQMVYLAGKMRPEHDWRDTIKRDVFSGVNANNLPSAWLEISENTSMVFNGTHFKTCGPFASSCDHGCGHKSDSLHMAQTCDEIPENRITAACMLSIESCDIVCAHLNTPDCFGTLVEIGIARGLAKKLCVTVDRQLAELMKRQPHYDDHGEPTEQMGQHDLWFACDVAHRSGVVESNEQARAVHGEFIRRHTNRAYRLMTSIALEQKKIALTFGDPVSVAHTGAYSRGFSIVELCRAWPAEAQAARAMRFA